MMHSQSRRGDRHSGVFLDVFHLIVGILVVVLGLLSFLHPEGHEVLFPLVFFLAAALNAVSGVFELKTQGHDKKKRRTGIIHILLTVVLAAVGVLSAISIWG